ncbi:MAG: hypothetical protein PHI44_03095 [Candidatus Ratteibacteria bacterium]|nr:hypothetical protein [Candidatus Ratteibacteria bacterium]
MDKKKIAVIIVFLILLEFRFVYIPAKRKVLTLDRSITARQKDRDTLIRLCEEYKEKGEGNEPLKIAGKEFSLLSYTGNLIEKRQLGKNVTGLQPLGTNTKDSVSIEYLRMGIRDITLQQLYDLLYDIEKTPEGIYISEFRMQKIKDKPHLLNVEIELFVAKEVGKDEGTKAQSSK